MVHPPVDVLVIGGGPAGAAAARLLALWGHRVLLRSARRRNAHALPESVVPSTGRLFDLLGIRALIDEAGFIRSTGHTVSWGGRQQRVERFARGARGWQVTAGALEGVLRRAAADAGARIEIGRVDAVDRMAHDGAYVLDCTGRAGVIARARGWRVYESRWRSIALVGRWQARTWALEDPTHTVIESYDGGWAWSVPTSSGDRWIALMIDPARSGTARGTAARQIYLEELRKTQLMAALAANAWLEEGPIGWDASMYRASCYAADNILLVGDAASFVDPLSSIGVKKALASGWLAAVAVNTALKRPAMRQAALDFFAQREGEIYEAIRKTTARFLADAAAGHDHPFWSDRGELAARRPDGERGAAARTAFERLRREPELRVERNPSLAIAARPAVSGAEIVLEDRIVSAEEPAGIRYAFDVDLLALLEIAPRHRSVPSAFEAYNQRCPPVAIPEFLAALSTALAKNWLRWV